MYSHMYEKESIERKCSCVEWSFKLTDIKLTVNIIQVLNEKAMPFMNFPRVDTKNLKMEF